MLRQKKSQAPEAFADTAYMELQSIGLGGLEKAQEKLQQSARRLANISGAATFTGGTYGPQGDRVDLSAEMVALKESKLMAEANLKVVETANEMSSRVIDILA